MNTIKKITKSRSLYGALMVLIFWFALHLIINSSIIPGPYETIINFIKIFPGTLTVHLISSLGRIIIAVVASLIIGVSIGLWIGLNDKADAMIAPIVYILYPVPKIAFLPVFMILFGLGNLSKIILITAIIIFQIIVTTRDGVKELTKELFYSMRSLGANKLQIYRYLILPAVLPKIITALRISVGTSISVLFFSENFATKYGIGYFIMNSWITVNYVQMFSGILALSIMGMVLFKLIDYIEDKLCVWVKISKADRI